MIKRNVQPTPPTNSAQNPTTYSYVYMRIQPFMTSIPTPQQSGTAEIDPVKQSTLQFVLYLADPVHQITHSSVTQTIPVKWLELWDKYEWVEDLIVEAIRVGVETIGQEYIVSRMGWDKKDGNITQEAAQPAETKAQ